MPVVSEGGDKNLREIEASGCFLRACRSCGERHAHLGSTDDWYRQGGRAAFSWGGCGHNLTLADRVGEVRLDTAGLTPRLR